MNTNQLNTDIINNFISYQRVSTDKQGESKLGLEAQQKAISDYIESCGGVLLNEFIEVESGKKSTNRPKLQEALKECKKRKAILIIAKLDRLARNVHFISGLLETNVDFVAVDNPNANKMMIQMLSCFAEFEREQISIRTKQALAAAKARGVKLGKYGATLAAENKRKAEEFAVKMKPIIEEIRADGYSSYAQIAEELNRRKVKSYKDGVWYGKTVWNLMN